jgi:1,6-anhydro-N-acetylmuramate kinase
LASRLTPLDTTEACGIAPGDREAVAMAVLGALAQDGASITLPQITGVNRPGRAGCWTWP